MLRIRPLVATLFQCPSDEFWTPERIRGLARSERSALEKHCARCQVCDAHRRLVEPVDTAVDIVTARVAAALVASVLLSAAIRFHPVRHFGSDDVYAFLPTQAAVQRAIAAQSEPQEEVTLEDDQLSVEQKIVSAPPRPLVIEPVGPRRTFIPPARRFKIVEPVNLEMPPVMANARLETPAVPGQTPSLQPPRRSPLKRFVSALAVPFRHI